MVSRSGGGSERSTKPEPTGVGIGDDDASSTRLVFESDFSELRVKAGFVGRFFLSTLEAVRRIVPAEGKETAPDEGSNTIEFDTGTGGTGGSSTLWAGANGEDEDFEPVRLLVHQLTLLASLLASCSPSDLYASSPSASNSLPSYVRNETFKKLFGLARTKTQLHS